MFIRFNIFHIVSNCWADYNIFIQIIPTIDVHPFLWEWIFCILFYSWANSNIFVIQIYLSSTDSYPFLSGQIFILMSPSFSLVRFDHQITWILWFQLESPNVNLNPLISSDGRQIIPMKNTDSSIPIRFYPDKYIRASSRIKAVRRIFISIKKSECMSIVSII